MKTIAEILLHPRDRAAIDDAVELLRRWFPVKEVISFGSKARGALEIALRVRGVVRPSLGLTNQGLARGPAIHVFRGTPMA